jgi:hypothetical protein
MGLTTGFLDAGVLTRLILSELLPGPPKASYTKVFEKYTAIRKGDFYNRIQKITVEGKMRIHSLDPKVAAEREDFFKMLNKNPGFGQFIASTLNETLPDSFSPDIG